MTHKISATPFPNPELIGSFYQFGDEGVTYQIMRPVRAEKDDWLIEIEIPETGERLEYQLKAALMDRKVP